jgi:hypothetical protein
VLLVASEALKPFDRTEMSVRNRIKTSDVDDVRVKGVSEPSGGNLKD